jgi:hypothetical protein
MRPKEDELLPTGYIDQRRQSASASHLLAEVDPVKLLEFVHRKQAWEEKFGSLSRNFDPSHSDWELVIMLRKASIACAEMFMTSYPLLQASVVCTVFVCSGALHHFNQPYRFPEINQLETVTLLSCFLVLMGGVMLYGEENFSKEQRDTLSGLLIAIIFAVTLYLAALLVYLAKRHARHEVDETQHKAVQGMQMAIRAKIHSRVLEAERKLAKNALKRTKATKELAVQQQNLSQSSTQYREMLRGQWRSLEHQKRELTEQRKKQVQYFSDMEDTIEADIRRIKLELHGVDEEAKTDVQLDSPATLDILKPLPHSTAPHSQAKGTPQDPETKAHANEKVSTSSTVRADSIEMTMLK